MSGVRVVNRRGISAVAVTIFGVIALLIGLLMFSTLTLALVRSVGSGGEIAGYRAQEHKAFLRVLAILSQEVSGGTLLNKTYIVIENMWPGDVAVDHIAITSKTGQKILDKTFSLTIKAGGSVRLAPSQIDQTLQVYDNDFWKFKREVDSVEFHADIGGVGASFVSNPAYIVGGSVPEVVVTTTTAQRTTTTATTYVTATTTSMIVTTPTTTVTTTCTRTTCSQILIQPTYYTISTSTVYPWTVTKTQILECRTIYTSYRYITTCSVVESPGYYCYYTVNRYYTGLYVTVYTTSIDHTVISTSCPICGTCPAGVYGSSEKISGDVSWQLYMIPLLSLAFIPRRLNSKKITLMVSVLLLFSVFSYLTGVKASPNTITVTVTVTGTPTTTTVTSTTTHTVTSTSTAPPATTTTTYTSLVTETRCLGRGTTTAVVQYSTAYTYFSNITVWCFSYTTIDVTETVVYTQKVWTYGSYIVYYNLRCGTWR